MRALILIGLVVLAAPVSAVAQSASGDGVAGGSPDVRVGRDSAARQGDPLLRGDVGARGSSNVFINGKPAMAVGDPTSCGGKIAAGSTTVFVNGKPLARRGDKAADCPGK